MRGFQQLGHQRYKRICVETLEWALAGQGFVRRGTDAKTATKRGYFNPLVALFRAFVVLPVFLSVSSCFRVLIVMR